jgi:hypothetical protein
VGKKTKGFVHRPLVRISDNLISFACEFRNCVSNRVIETLIECMEFIISDWRVVFGGQFSNSLTEVPIIVDDLIQSEPHQQQLRAMVASGLCDFDARP